MRDLQNTDTKDKTLAQAKMAAAAALDSEEDKTLGELKGMMHKLTQQFNNMQQELKDFKQTAASQASAEQGQKGAKKGRSNQGVTEGQRSGGKEGKESSGNTVQCYGCGGRGHFKRDCPSKRVPTCWNCGERGHTKWKCPQSDGQDLNSEKPLLKGER